MLPTDYYILFIYVFILFYARANMSIPHIPTFRFCDLSVKAGMDIFRVFDSLNYLPNLMLGVDAVGKAGKTFESSVVLCMFSAQV